MTLRALPILLFLTLIVSRPERLLAQRDKWKENHPDVTKDTSADPDPNDFIDVEVEPEPIKPIQSFVSYPPEAIRAQLEGKVILNALIDTSGNVMKVVIDQSSGFEILDAAGKDALEQAKFKPARQKGKAVKVWYMVPISFRLQ